MLTPLACGSRHVRAVLVQQCLLRSALGAAFTCTFTILNNSVPSEARGRMQGVAMTVGSLARAIGPAMGAELFAWSLTNGIGFPFDVHFLFLLMCIMNLANVAIALITFTTALDLPFEASPPGASTTSTQMTIGLTPASRAAAPALESPEERT